MHRLSQHRVAARVVTLVAVAVALMGAGLLGAHPAFAAKSTAATPTTELESKQAQQQSVTSEVDRMRIDLSLSLQQYIDVVKQIEDTQSEIDALDVQISDLDASLLAGKRELAKRAIELYRSQRVSMLEMLLASSSIQDFFNRADYLSRISRKDARLIDDIRISRQESAWLQNQLEVKMVRLTGLEKSADDQRQAIEDQIAARQKRIAELQSDINRLSAPVGLFSGNRPIGAFDPNTVVSQSGYCSPSMDATAVQSFLNKQSGPLKSYRGKDHAGRVVSAAEMIAEAGKAWGVSPKAILVTLQKEQSLISRGSASSYAMDWAMGCGKADSRTYYQYQGFGKQIWFGAQKLKQNGAGWKPGIHMTIDGDTISPTNPATYSLYKYTPHFPGVTRFWMLWWRYFGNPQAPA